MRFLYIITSIDIKIYQLQNFHPILFLNTFHFSSHLYCLFHKSKILQNQYVKTLLSEEQIDQNIWSKKIKTRKQYSGFLIQEVVQGLKLLRRDMSAHLETEAVNDKSCLKRVWATYRFLSPAEALSLLLSSDTEQMIQVSR